MEYAWRNLQSLTLWLRRLLYLNIAIGLFSLVDAACQRSAFRRLAAHGVAPSLAVQNTNHADLLANNFVSIPLTCVALATTILAAIWIYRAAVNLRALGAPDLTIGPGWAIGWYFIPIANWWKPYQAMKEIWQASARPQQWRDSATPPLLRMWWAMWLLRFFVPWTILMAAGTATRHGDAAGGWLLNNAAQMAGSLIDMPLALLFALLVGTIWRMQSDHAAPPSSTMPAAGVPGTIG